jgi:hypothetical protein
VQRLRSDFIHIAERLRSHCKPIVQRFYSNSAALSLRLRSNPLFLSFKTHHCIAPLPHSLQTTDTRNTINLLRLLDIGHKNILSHHGSSILPSHHVVLSHLRYRAQRFEFALRFNFVSSSPESAAARSPILRIISLYYAVYAV